MDPQAAQDIRNWWGLARRRSDEEIVPTLIEKLTCFLAAALVINLLWLVVLSLWPLRTIFRWTIGYWTEVLYLPLGVSLLALLFGLTLPSTLLNRTALAGIVGLAREKGWLTSIDRLIALAAVAGLVLGGFRLSGLDHWPTLLSVCALVLIVAIGLSCFKKPTWLVARKWEVSMPEWLRNGEPEQQPVESPLPPVPPPTVPKPNVIYSYDLLGKESPKTVEVAIYVDEESVIKPLREINLSHNGRLYLENELKNAVKVVLSQGDPANGLGLQEIDAVCQQILAAAQKAGLTRYQLASSVLRFVQRGIEYEDDAKSTARILGQQLPEYGRFPIETLFDRVGDRNCTSILCAALLSRLGYETLLINLPNHIALGLKITPELFSREFTSSDPLLNKGTVAFEGERYLYAETATDEEDPIGFGVVPPEVDLGQIEAAVRIPAGGGT